MTTVGAILSPERVAAKVRNPLTAADFRTMKDGPQLGRVSDAGPARAVAR